MSHMLVQNIILSLLWAYCISHQYKILSPGYVLCSRFDVDVPGGAVYKESSFTEAGRVPFLFSTSEA